MQGLASQQDRGQPADLDLLGFVDVLHRIGQHLQQVARRHRRPVRG
jgi:hypothetical protein